MCAKQIETGVAIIGAGPAGLLLGRMLDLQGVDNVIFESRDRGYVERRQRAGVVEPGTVDFIRQLGLDRRLRRDGLEHGGIELRFAGRGHRIALDELTDGKTVTIYAQTEIVKDFIAARLEQGHPLYFDFEIDRIAGLESRSPSLQGHFEGDEVEVRCELVAACDGFHGIGRSSMPRGSFNTVDRSYPYAWLGILVDAPPSSEELIYCHSERGFALHSMRSPSVGRFYLQVGAEEKLEDWSDDRIWSELAQRLAQDDWVLGQGPVLERGITPMRGLVGSPMQHGRLFLAGDAAHIVPPTGAKGLNLAASDARLLGEAICASLLESNDALLAAYTSNCLRGIWRAQDFSYWMTRLLHLEPDGVGSYEWYRQLARLDYVTSSPVAAAWLAENYVGLDRLPPAV
jgi:p-hydroxybenzoate 3-monooxygenase